MRVAWVCEGGGRLGWGHVGRGRAVLEAAGAGSALVIGRGRREMERWASRSGVAWGVRSWARRTCPFPVGPWPFDVTVVDHYTLSAVLLEAGRRRGPLALLDDWMRSRFEVPMLVNANIGAKPTDYPFGHAQRWLTGAKAALLRSEVRSARRARPPSGAVREILVTFGGSDPRGISAVVAADLRRTAWFRQGGQLTLVLGASYHGPPVRAGRRFEVVQSTADFVARCAAADLVVSGAATTTYELAHLGTPFIPVATVDNQERISMSWARAGVGPGLSTTQRGWRAALCRAVEEAAHDPAASRIAARRVRRLVDGRGVKRLLTALAQPVERGGPRG